MIVCPQSAVVHMENIKWEWTRRGRSENIYLILFIQRNWSLNVQQRHIKYISEAGTIRGFFHSSIEVCATCIWLFGLVVSLHKFCRLICFAFKRQLVAIFRIAPHCWMGRAANATSMADRVIVSVNAIDANTFMCDRMRLTRRHVSADANNAVKVYCITWVCVCMCPCQSACCVYALPFWLRWHCANMVQ